MKEQPRLIVSFTLTVLLHAGFIFYVAQSAATAPSNSASTVMQFNMGTLAKPNEVEQEKPSAQPSKDVNLASKTPIVQTPTPVKTAIKKVLVEKERPINKELVQTKEQPIASNNDTQTKIDPLVVVPTASRQSQENTMKNISVARQVDDTIVQQARFKSLPPAPSYPRRARLRGQQGTALIHAQLNITGEVIKTRLAKSSGFSLLDKAAIKAVYHWDFMPGATELGRVQVWVEIPVQFILQSVKLG
jgi:protein TonB